MAKTRRGRKSSRTFYRFNDDLINDLINDFINDPIKLSETEAMVLQLFGNVHGIKKKELAEKTKKSEATVQRAVKRLVELGLVRREGSNKTGHWEVIGKEQQERPRAVRLHG